ncbi:hypothetical protein SAMN05216370_0919 [Pseudomonas peli]|uniref:Uncharacterized protein n=1 Tax=Pseudomonas peli TaxID=592361 RepID=A0AB37Z476_9PSED|nr:hypothetical protein [Pseudomonas peli]NMZ68819.1 hypothetical protein [Pseudomonas peli]SCW39515.1 hypothetical protein SAMN05216370_0919 [Pseudomonas peli]
METSARPTRGRQAAPTKPEINEALAGVRQEATAGNLYAMIALIFSAKFDEQTSTLKALRDDVSDLALTIKADSMRRLNAQLMGEFTGAIDSLRVAMLAAAETAAAKQ